MEVIDRRKFGSDGERVAQDEPQIALPEDISRKLISAISDVREYGPPHPILDYVLILETKADTEYEGTRIIVPDIAKELKNKGVVIAISPVLAEHGVPLGGVWVPSFLKVGDVATYSQFCERFERGDDVFVLVRIHDIKFVEPVAYAVARS
jgi:co-chaperonin GroES (HSP10)